MTPTFIKRLHRDERGFLSPIILYMTIALALMIVLDNTRDALRDLAMRNKSHACVLVV